MNLGNVSGVRDLWIPYIVNRAMTSLIHLKLSNISALIKNETATNTFYVFNLHIN